MSDRLAMLHSTTYLQACCLDPRIERLFSCAVDMQATPGYRKHRTFAWFKEQLAELVGWQAATLALRDPRYYEVLLPLMYDCLPEEL